MATTKKPAKRSVKKTTHRKPTKKPAAVRSFRLATDEPPFTTFKITRQTVYWIILVAFIVAMQLWILKIQTDITALTDALLLQQQ